MTIPLIRLSFKFMINNRFFNLKQARSVILKVCLVYVYGWVRVGGGWVGGGELSEKSSQVKKRADSHAPFLMILAYKTIYLNNTYFASAIFQNLYALNLIFNAYLLPTLLCCLVFLKTSPFLPFPWKQKKNHVVSALYMYKNDKLIG